jgi:multidrug transporter EmrE-like cation transporter
MIYYIALFLSITLNAASLIMLKQFALIGKETEIMVADNLFGSFQLTAIIKRLLNPLLVISVIFYGFAALLWMVALLKVDLMVAYPSLSVTYVLIALISTGLFNEQITSRRWAGMALIVAGVIVMNIG